MTGNNNKHQRVISSYYFILFITVCCFVTTILFYIINPINISWQWKQRNYNSHDEESIFIPFTSKKVPTQWRHHITNQPLNYPNHHPKLYYPRNCPNDKINLCAKPIPSFIFAGSELAGASFVFQILKEHPQVINAVDNSDKPTIFLDREEVEDWDESRSSNVLFETYLSQFPYLDHDLIQDKGTKNWVVGENAPQYLYKSHLTAKRIKEILPHVKLVFFLKDPISRAYSQYLHEKKSNSELSFETLIDLELPILRRCGHTSTQWEGFVRCHEGSEIRAAWKVMGSDDTQHTFNSLAKGMYYPALIPFLQRFPSSQLFIIRTEDLLSDSLAVFQKLAKFLEIDPDYFLNNTWKLHDSSLTEEDFYASLNEQQEDNVSTDDPQLPQQLQNSYSLDDIKVKLNAEEEEPRLSSRYRLQKLYRDLNDRLIEIFDPSLTDFNGWVYDVDQG
ncbi:MAG: P-loop containing nucleoside triphosphate hydrolase protein [Benjaminiella poitrasii]|nr:MAG: P-loop containing nucleoside triphosphate hydrolase protein [Benjaminiella poitrasii]